jgi:hypothetical protein
MAGFNTYYEASVLEAALAYYLDLWLAFVKEDYHSLAFCSSCSYDVVIAFDEHLRVDWTLVQIHHFIIFLYFACNDYKKYL